MSVTTLFPFTTPGNYTFPSTLEVTGGFGALKDQIDPEETAYNNFATKDLFRNVAGSAVGTLATGAVINAGNFLEIPNVGGSWTFNPQSMLGGDPNIGCIRLKIAPQYNGTPGTDQYIYEEKEASGRNRILIQHKTGTGNLQIEFRNSLGAGAGTLIAIAGWSPVSGNTYEIELNFNTTSGTQKLYLNGVQQGPDHGASYTRTSTATIASIGFFSIVQNFNVDDFQRFETVKHTADFSSEIPRVVPLTPYSITNPKMKINIGISATDILAFVETFGVKAGLDELKYTFEWLGQEYYLVANLPVVSDGTYAQSNTIAEITAALPIDINPDSEVFIWIHFHSDNGLTTPTIDEISATYDFDNPGTVPVKCMVYGQVVDNCCNPVEGAIIEFDGDDYFYGSALIGPACQAITDENGEWQLQVIETSSNGKTLTVTQSYFQNGKKVKQTCSGVTIPNQSTVALSAICTLP